MQAARAVEWTCDVVVIEPAQGAKRRTDLVLHPAAYLRRRRFQLL
jgi:hypothetical protein